MAVNYLVHGSKISDTAAAILKEAGVSASRLDRRFDKRVAQRLTPFIWGPKDYRLKKIRDRTGISVEMISRERRTILLWVRRFEPYVDYQELSQNNCCLEIHASIPESVSLNATCKKLNDVINGLGDKGMEIFGDLTITGIRSEGPRLIFNVKQNWNPVRPLKGDRAPNRPGSD